MKLKDAYNLMKELKEKHSLYDWGFKFDRSVRRFGLCSYRRKTIYLSKKLTLLNDMNIVKNVILHEIAHALVNSHNGHNEIWEHKALSIGCDAQRCYDPSKVIRPKKKYRGKCPVCDNIVLSHKRTVISCGMCWRQSFNKQFLIKWELNKEE